ncbi:hypothetical protein FHW69_003156 [Luteibacter sp. Sphag1AF]|uniref:LytR/AlgR family response regulator transcription factor n=1 Tax=Luteibacter sp. Sphag1AF TaxID=2587031 RepID=UPI00161CCC16|nr:LytTR family DNA-binding domain-containing protein [Luteibacter sp. Sphag1AF]MBB3228514.1 hypothetical protein [Luteibacter sp. Sphag1AF]
MKLRTFDLLAILAVFVAYTLTIRLAMGLDFIDCMLTGAANTVPVVLFGAIVRRVVVKRLIGSSTWVQIGAHVLMGTAFVVLSYVVLIVLLGLLNGAGPGGFLIKPFSMAGAAWQSLENVTTYALIVMVSYVHAQHGLLAQARRESEVSASRDDIADAKALVEPRTDPSLSRYFVRIGEELRPLDIDTVVSIGGADDYAEVRTLTGKHLVRVTLAEFARSLDPAKYVRVHRSLIVNVQYIARAESAGGGRLLLHMENGQTLSTSRAGARLLRDRVI